MLIAYAHAIGRARAHAPPHVRGLRGRGSAAEWSVEGASEGPWQGHRHGLCGLEGRYVQAPQGNRQSNIIAL